MKLNVEVPPRIVGTRWTALMIEHGVGASQDHPVETQRVYAALLNRREVNEISTNTHPFTYEIDCDLDDLDVTVHFAQEILAGKVNSADSTSLTSSVNAFERMVQQLARTTAFRGVPFADCYKPLPAYRAFRCAIPGKNNKPFAPVKRLAQCDSPQAGIIYPYQMTAPAWLNDYAVYCFVPDGEELEPAMRIALRSRKKVTSLIR